MSTRYNTGNPIESTDVRDMSDNAKNFDEFSNSMSDSFTDRFGRDRQTIEGSIRKAGFQPASFDFVTGGTLVSGDRNKAVFNPSPSGDDNWYAWQGAFPKIISPSSTPATSGGLGDNAWKPVTNNVLAPTVSESIRRSYAEVGYNLVAGSFEAGGTVTTVTDVLIYEAEGKAYSYTGTLPHTVSSGSSPSAEPGMWTDQSALTLRSQLSGLVGGEGEYVYTANGVDDSAGLLAANAQAVANKTKLRIIGVAKVISPVTISAQLYDSLNQIFTIDSAVSISNSQTKVRPEMFGDVDGALDKCVQVLPVFGGSIYLEEARYKTSRYQYGFAGAGKFIGKDNISIIGKRMPDGNASLTHLENGSIIEGSLLVWANNPGLSNLGVDCGKSVVDAYYGGTVAPGITEGLILTFSNDAAKGSGTTKKGARLHNVCGLVYSPTALVHAVIVAEGYVDTVCTGTVHGMMGTHGVVIKASRVTADRILAECNGGEGMVIKSDDQLSATSNYIKINYLRASRNGLSRTPHTAPPTAGTIGLMLHSTGVNGIDQVMIDTFLSDGHAFGVKPVKTNLGDIINVEFGVANVDLLTATGSTLAVYYPEDTSTLLQMSFDELHARNGQQAISLGKSKNRIRVGHLDTKALTDCLVDLQDKSVVTIDAVDFKDHTGTGKWRINLGGVLKVGSVTAHNADVAEFASGGVTVALNSGHTAPVQALTARLVNYGLELNGLVKSPSVTACITLPAGLRPKQNIRRSTTIATAPSVHNIGLLTIATDGSVVINEGYSTTPAEWGSIAAHFAF